MGAAAFAIVRDSPALTSNVDHFSFQQSALIELAGAVPNQATFAGIGLAPCRLTLGACPGTTERGNVRKLGEKRRQPIASQRRRVRESVVLIFNRARLLSASWRAAYAGAALTLPLVTLAYADTLYVGGCVGAPGAVSCVLRVGPAGDPYVRTVPQPENEADKARATERDQKWLQRCRPIVAQDRYGVPRYHYAAAGCAFGVIE